MGRTKERRLEEAANQLRDRRLRPSLVPELLQEAALQHACEVMRSVARLNAFSHSPIAIVPDALWGGGCIWGTRWPHHPFGERKLLRAMNLTEPQVTRELAYWFSNSHRLGAQRRALFIDAVLDAAGCAELGAWRDLLRRARVSHFAELDPTLAGRTRRRSGTRRNGALDLLFVARDGSETRELLIEAKIDAPTDRGQLSAYREVTRARLKQATCVLLARGRPQLRRNSPWRYCSWRAVLAGYENRLADIEDVDPSFRLFRSELFWRLGQ